MREFTEENRRKKLRKRYSNHDKAAITPLVTFHVLRFCGYWTAVDRGSVVDTTDLNSSR